MFLLVVFRWFVLVVLVGTTPGRLMRLGGCKTTLELGGRQSANMFSEVSGNAIYLRSLNTP